MIPGGTQLLSKKPELMAPNYWPAYYTQATGCEIIDEVKPFLDMASNAVLSCLLGYADPDVNNAVLRRVQMGSMLPCPIMMKCGWQSACWRFILGLKWFAMLELVGKQ